MNEKYCGDIDHYTKWDEKRLLIVGARGQGKVTLDCALYSGMYLHISFMSNDVTDGGVSGYPLLDQNTSTIEYILHNFDEVIVAVGLQNAIRLQLSLNFEVQGMKLATLIHPTSVVSQFAEVGEGSILLAHSVVNPFAKVGKACIINTGAIVEHDCVIGDGVHLSPNATIAGRVHIGKNTWVCIGSSVAHDVTIGEDVVIGAGAVVLQDIPRIMSWLREFLLRYEEPMSLQRKNDALFFSGPQFYHVIFIPTLTSPQGIF